MIAEGIRQKFERLRTSMNERVRRLWAGTEAMALARGGISIVARATGMSRNTIRVGIAELKLQSDGNVDLPLACVRRAGGGGKRLEETDPTLILALEELIAPATRGDPMSPLRWTQKSTHPLAKALTSQGHSVSARTVAAMLKALDYSLQGNSKTREGSKHEDRDAQFRHINAGVLAMQSRGQPVVSVDAKKKELVGDFKNNGKEWQPKGKPAEVRVYDFVDKAPDKGRVTPYGVYDLTANEGRVSVGTDHGPLRRSNHSEMVAGNGPRPLPQRNGIVGHRRWRWLQFQPLSTLENRLAGTGRRNGAGVERLPLSTGHEQVEQNRASAVLPRHAKLARQASGQSRSDRQTDRQYDNDHGPEGESGT